MSLYVIGDTHLSFGVNKPMDIFTGWSDYVSRLEQNWRNTVGDDDVVLIAGDISWGLDLNESLPDFKFIESLPGKKILMKGNHDYWWQTKSKMDKFFLANEISTISILHNNSYRIGNISVCGTRGWFYDAHGEHDEKVIRREAGRLKKSFEEAQKLGGEPVAFLHYPPVFGGVECPEIMDTLRECGIKRCYYGHLHGKKNHASAVSGIYDGIEFYLISGDYTQFRLIPVSDNNNFTENS